MRRIRRQSEQSPGCDYHWWQLPLVPVSALLIHFLMHLVEVHSLFANVLSAGNCPFLLFHAGNG